MGKFEQSLDVMSHSEIDYSSIVIAEEGTILSKATIQSQPTYSIWL